MIINKDDIETIHSISLTSGVDELDVEKVFQAFLAEFTFKYTNNKQIKVPFIGNFLVRWREDVETDSGRESQLDAFFSPHDEIKRIVGQLKDIEKTGDCTQLDTFTLLKKIVKQDFKNHIAEQM